MKTPYIELLELQDHLYRSQISGLTREDIYDIIKSSQNDETELLIEALIYIVELRNRGYGKSA